MTSNDRIRNSIDGSEIANVVQAGSIGSVHIGGPATDVRSMCRSAYAALSGIVTAMDNTVWTSADSVRENYDRAHDFYESANNLLVDFEMFAPSFITKAFELSRYSAFAAVKEMYEATKMRDGRVSSDFRTEIHIELLRHSVRIFVAAVSESDI
ncbi:hypothetical protein ADK60_19960 [Streptomyces sp. XY431]|uniref:hypothetical protein n=1 Tax=Streptomyces sp. XY431 TaxID=1415562 RepID=UPI0006AFD525|nr:hypothetical protein [Streptomyces sp. XY431]KOV27253.1 hypothetical protein ADK60_19960 [Streptomyces sp. XY431]